MTESMVQQLHSVVVNDLHVRYRVIEETNRSAAQLVRAGLRTRRTTEVHALRGVTLTVDVGESVGIVGANGSGKSTLLRCLAGVQQVASGTVRVRGSAHLLAVNAALDPTASGRRNVFLGGLAMGLPHAEIEDRLPDLIEFTELGEAMNRPMRSYSSGMKARLAFSIATMRQPDILLVDEALAVGDKAFRRKSLARIRELQNNAGTVIMVTHNLNEIRSTCSRAIWVEQGCVVMDGDTEAVLGAYEQA